MRKRIVLWGADNEDKKLLLALELNEKENSVNLYKFSEALATEELYKKLMDEWRDNKEVTFPEGTQTVNRALSVTENLLPEDIKTERTDLVNQAKAEWHFTVLSSKLYEYYSSELVSIKEKVEALSTYDNRLWDDIKSFWGKVQEQMKDENLFKGHGYKLKKSTNEVFDKLKELRKVMDTEVDKASAIIKKEYISALEVIEEKIDKGLGLQPLFNELKKMQQEFKNASFSRSDRNKVWKRIDKAFKSLKEKKYGSQASSGNNEFDRLKNRYDGLLSAINRMEQSLNRDKRDKTFQDKRINDTDGQLELQLRQAKILMIEQRISSKQERLDDMLKTKSELDEKLKRVEIKMKKQAEKKVIEQKKEELKVEIEKKLESKKESLDVDVEKLKKAAAEIKASKTKKIKKEANMDKVEKKEEGSIAVPPVVIEIADKVEDVIETVTENVESIVDFVGDKVEGFIDALKGDEEE